MRKIYLVFILLILIFVACLIPLIYITYAIFDMTKINPLYLLTNALCIMYISAHISWYATEYILYTSTWF